MSNLEENKKVKQKPCALIDKNKKTIEVVSHHHHHQTTIEC